MYRRKRRFGNTEEEWHGAPNETSRDYRQFDSTRRCDNRRQYQRRGVDSIQGRGHRHYSDNRDQSRKNQYHSRFQDYRQQHMYGRGRRGQSTRRMKGRFMTHYDRSWNDRKYKMSIGPKPHSISQKSISYLSQYPFWATEKSDGQRLLCCIVDESRTVFIDSKFDIHEMNREQHGLPPLTVLDGELVIAHCDNVVMDKWTVSGYIRQFDSISTLTVSELQSIQHLIFEHFHIFQHRLQTTYLIFDCVVFDGVGISNQNSSVRFEMIDRFMNIYHQQLWDHFKNEEDVSWRKRDDVHFKNAEDALSRIAIKQNDNDFASKQFKDWFLDLIHRECHSLDLYQKKNDSKCSEMSFLDIIASNQCLTLKFTKKKRFRATKQGLKQLFERITNVEGHFWFRDPMTGIRNLNDGVVFTPEHNGYFMKRDPDHIEMTRKWKPKELNTVDVQVNGCTDAAVLGMYAFDMIKKEMVKFDEMKIIDRDLRKRLWNLGQCAIVECAYSADRGWYFMRERRDKIRGNSLQTCLSVKKAIASPITVEQLIHHCPQKWKC